MAIQVTQVRSAINVQKQHRGTLRALGLGRIGKSRTHEDNPVIRGMIHQVSYLIEVSENVEGNA
jgi:large subunit ribosomal protein L30